MKRIALCLILTIATNSMKAQIQNGLVREQNSGKKPIADATVIFTDAVPTTSDRAGKFRLAFLSKKAGDLIFYKEIICDW